METFDVIVLGAGAVGSAAASEAARRGVRVLALDRFGAGHSRGSSHGQSRLIRRAYYEHPAYVPLVERSFDHWNALSEQAGERLLKVVGLLQVGPGNGPVLSGVRQSAARHRLEIVRLASEEITRRWPGVRVDANWEGVYEPGAAYLRVERAILAQLSAAARAGAALRLHEEVRELEFTANTVIVRTEAATYDAARLIVAAGAWSSQWLAPLRGALVVRRKPQFWFATRGPDYRADAGFGAFLFETPQGVFYGFPELSRGEIKIAEHSGGGVVPDPATVPRELDPTELLRVRAFARRQLPKVDEVLRAHAVCMYTMSPDEHFIVDRHPRWPHVVMAAGLSGHGFKFAPVLGEALADLALDARTELPIELFRVLRPGLPSIEAWCAPG